ncbi:lysozyme [Neodiprion lecontei]|uniref:lysozyme n=1 Tax=Neodiprion lecontei TaxID=441921 RepID=A0A6J0BL95_NEOLC|nr:lysozyme [Neodiprion lecontei]XP_015515023.1 lysozyme [Neodiprion lecontei]
MKALFVVLALLLVTVSHCTGKTFTRCGLALELDRQGLDRGKMNDWVCLVEKESARNTSAIGGPNRNGSYDYGLFQINGNIWCSLGVAGSDCNIKCEDLLDDDITDDVRCAKKIYRRHKFYAWNGWKNGCLNKVIPDVHYCFN